MHPLRYIVEWIEHVFFLFSLFYNSQGKLQRGALKVAEGWCQAVCTAGKSVTIAQPHRGILIREAGWERTSESSEGMRWSKEWRRRLIHILSVVGSKRLRQKATCSPSFQSIHHGTSWQRTKTYPLTPKLFLSPLPAQRTPEKWNSHKKKFTNSK